MAVKGVLMFERAMPKYVDLIPKNLFDILLFVVYINVVLYVGVSVTWFCTKKSLSVFCCICCCGCCSRKAAGSGKKASNGAKRVAEKAQANTKDTKATPAAAKKKAKA